MKLMQPVTTALTLALVALGQSAVAATTATIDLNTQKFIGGVSNLDRSKYFNMHTQPRGLSLQELDYLVNDLDVGFGRYFYSPFSAYAGDAPYPSEATAKQEGPVEVEKQKQSDRYRFRTRNAIVTDHAKKTYVTNENPVLAANWAANYFKHYFDNETRPKYYEPMNEPYVKAGDFGNDQAKTRMGMAKLFAEIGKKFKQQNINTKIIGYASAWPSMELWDFRHFDERMKMFMDIAGPHIDSFSVHPYDGVNVTGANSQRSGSNVESILDLIETYSHFKWNRVKPITISEYGGIEKGYPAGYSDVKHVQSIRSINNMIFEFIDREDRMLTTIPFITARSPSHPTAANGWAPYGADLLRPDPNSIVDGKPTKFLYTPRIWFFQMWQNVSGKRVKALSNNEDIQVQAFVNGKKAYVALNSLAESNEVVNLNFLKSLGNPTNVRRKSLKIYANSNPKYQDNTIATPKSLTLVPGETVILEYSYNGNIPLNNKLEVKTYYSKDYLKKISANTDITFKINGIKVAKGQSVLKMGLGRDHNKSKRPVIKVNGTTVSVPSNWAGGSQASRKSFFGTIRIPVNNSVLKTNNTITVKFPDAGGRVSSMILELNNDNSGNTGGGSTGGDTGGGNTGGDVTPPTGATTLQVRHSSKCFDVAGGATENGTAYHQWTCNTSNVNQRFVFEDRGNGLYGIKSERSNRCIDVAGGATTNGGVIHQWDCANGNVNQSWKLVSKGGDWFEIVSQRSGKCLDVAGVSSANGAKFHQWECLNGQNQQYKFVK